ncbi:hypothetical protein PoB_001154500 [Plakobranchus ocellatus]|uniref:Uncharacterized protein n=1 Tax=Plakobranchus ocellatus TaxID=259542 RepID=A0AAV3YPG9_9GAST|nr:hypothetical protein PoB_001154500 [Plakobranchus ocellatus]
MYRHKNNPDCALRSASIIMYRHKNNPDCVRSIVSTIIRWWHNGKQTCPEILRDRFVTGSSPTTAPDSPQQGNLKLSGPPSGKGAGGGARTRDRWIPADLRADSLTVPPTPRILEAATTSGVKRTIVWE